MYDIDGNGMVDPGETVAVMTAILDLVKSLPNLSNIRRARVLL